MRLQLRVRHSLGSRMIEVEGQGREHPARIGRNPDAEVQIPSGTVAPVHCLLYEQDGRWILEGVDPSAATLVNNEPLGDAMYLASGDTIAVGSGATAAVIEVDPMGLARRAMRAPLAAPRPASPDEAPAAAAEESGYSEDEQWPLEGTPAPQSAPEYASSAPTTGYSGGEDEQWSLDSSSAGAEDSGYAPQPTPHRGRRYVRSSQSAQSNAVLVGVAIGILLVILVIVILVQVGKDSTPTTSVQKAPTIAPVQEATSSGPRNTRKNIFDDMEKSARPKVQQAPSGFVQYRPQPANNNDDDMAPATRPTDPLKQTDDWKNVEEARRSSDYGSAIWIFEDYRERFPNQFADELKKDLETALDSLWWQRIKGLCDRRNEIRSEIEDVNRKLAEEDNPDFKKQFENDKSKLEFQRENIGQILSEDMGYTLKETPNDQDPDQIDRLRRQRDSEKFTKWSEKVIKSVKTTREVPWKHSR